MCRRAGRSPQSQKRASDSLDLELLVVVSHQMWVLGTELGPLEEQGGFLTIRPSPQIHPLPVLKTAGIYFGFLLIESIKYISSSLKMKSDACASFSVCVLLCVNLNCF